MQAIVLARFLAIYPNSLPYLSDIKKKDLDQGSWSIGECFGDVVLNQAGDCEDSARFICQLWSDFTAFPITRCTHPHLAKLKRVAESYKLFGVLCTVPTLTDMAHMTTVLRRKDFATPTFPKIMVVEGTNMITPFGYNPRKQPASLHTDDTYSDWARDLAMMLPNTSESRTQAQAGEN